jgi:hypothetical protein
MGKVKKIGINLRKIKVWGISLAKMIRVFCISRAKVKRRVKSEAKANKFGIRGANMGKLSISVKKGGKFGVSEGEKEKVGITGHKTKSLA